MKSVMIALLALATANLPAKAEEAQTLWINPSKAVDVYWSLNLSGTAYVAADVDGRPACLDYWWIKWPTTSIKSLGRQCGSAAFTLPGLSELAIGGKLRAGNASERTRLRGTASEKVARDFLRVGP
jgi:hypothetical protein